MGSSATRAAKRSARAILKARQPRRTHFDIVVGDGDLAGLTVALGKARKALEDAQAKTGALRGPAVERATAALSAAKAAYDEQVDRIYFVGLPPRQYEALRIANPDPPAKLDEPNFELSPFVLALLAACTVDSDLTAEEWLAETREWTAIDQNRLTVAVLSANIRPSVPALGKA